MNYVAYRGEHGDVPDLSTRHGAITFCDEFRTCQEYALIPNNPQDVVFRPRVIIGAVRIRHPFINQPVDPFLELGHVVQQLGFDEAYRIACKYADHIEHTNHWQEDIAPHHPGSVREYLDNDPSRITDLYFASYPFFDCAYEIAGLKAWGYDGAIIGCTGLGSGTTEYRPFSTEQVSVQYVIQL